MSLVVVVAVESPAEPEVERSFGGRIGGCASRLPSEEAGGSRGFFGVGQLTFISGGERA